MADVSSASVASAGAATSSRGQWSEEELAIALRGGAELETTTKGLCGKLVEVREHDVVLALPFPGRAYIRKSDIATPPPTRFEPGTRVKTPYGKGVVRQRRWRPETPAGLDYAVDLIECRMAGHTLAAPAVATGYLAQSQLSFRSDDERTAAERLADAEVLRTQGNDAFKAKDYASAMAQYERATEVLGGFRGPRHAIDDETRAAFLDCFVKTLGNCAAVSLSSGEWDRAIYAATQAMQLDERDQTRQMGKNLRRRAKAFAQTKEFEAATRDLTIAAKLEPEEWAKDPSWAALLKQCSDAVTKAKAKEKKTWEGAFAKLGGGAASNSANSSAIGDAGSSGSAASSAAPSPAPLSRAASGGAGAAASASAGAGAGDADRHVHFKSPDQGALRVSASGRQLVAAHDQAAGADGTPERGEKRTLFAGHTPHPTKSKRGQGASAGGDDDDDDDDGSDDGGFSPEDEEAEADGSGTAEMEPGLGLGTKLALGLGAAAVIGVGVAAAMRFLRSRKSGGADAPGIVHDAPAAAFHVEIPASVAAKLSGSQLDELQAFANEKGAKHSRKHIVCMEKHMASGKSFEEAHKAAQGEVGE